MQAAAAFESGRTPKQVHLLVVALVAIAALTIWAGFDAVVPTAEFDPSDEFGPALNPNPFAYATIAVGLGCVICAVMVYLRSGAAAGIGLILGAAGLGRAIEALPWTYLEIPWARLYSDVWWRQIAEAVSLPGVKWLCAGLALLLIWILWRLFARQAAWFGMNADKPTSSAIDDRWRIVGVWLLALFGWFLFRHIGTVSIVIIALQIGPAEALGNLLVPLEYLDAFLPLVIASGIMVTQLDRRADVDRHGVRISLASIGLTLLRARWHQIYRVEIVRHLRRAPTAVIKFKWHFLPMSFSLHGDRYQNGQQLVDEITRETTKRNIEIGAWRVSDNARVIALALAVFGIVTILYMQHKVTTDWLAFSQIDFPPPANFKDLANPVFYGGLVALAMFLFGAALGVLSAGHHAGPRPILLAAWIIGASAISPEPIIPWLVWMAIFSIYMATVFPPEVKISHPSNAEWEIGFFLSNYAVVLSAVAYIIAIYFMLRRIPIAPQSENLR